MKCKYKAGIYTLGCRVNQYESEAIGKALEQHGFELCDFSDTCDVYIINTCTVTAESDRKCRQMIRRAIKKNPAARVLVCGCYAQMFADEIAGIGGIDYISGTKDKLKIVGKAIALAEEGKRQTVQIDVKPHTQPVFESMQAVSQDRTRAYIKIEDGCENKCTYCIIPKARGKICSKEKSEVLNEVKELAANGYREIVLVGIEIAAYGKDRGCDLITLLEELENIDGPERIRLGSVDPAYLKKDIIDRLAKLKKLMPHYHLSLQSGCDRTLHSMKRRNNAKAALDSIEYMREKIPSVTFGADIIVGFPGETDRDFEETRAFLQKARILNMHIFSYSKRPGTEAADMEDQVEEQIKEKRSSCLQADASSVRKSLIEEYIQKKTELSVLFEAEKDGRYIGHTGNFIEVEVESETELRGQIKNVVLTGTGHRRVRPAAELQMK